MSVLSGRLLHASRGLVSSSVHGQDGATISIVEARTSTTLQERIAASVARSWPPSATGQALGLIRTSCSSALAVQRLRWARARDALAGRCRCWMRERANQWSQGVDTGLDVWPGRWPGTQAGLGATP